ncbi:MAG: polyprenyl synthetase family protein [Bacteroidales bacterium]|jgi:geranylgeranyl diphosphate synthase type II|nr:polyprenyl synthetase family protein [Bacteroidales bacterium]
MSFLFENNLRIFNEYLAGVKFANGKNSLRLYEPIDYVLSFGGKRIRPVLTMMAYELFGGTVTDVLPQAAGIEIFHNFTLLHDDIMDNATVRRGRDTVHKKWNTNTAILSGDAMLILAYKYITDISAMPNTPISKTAQLLQSFNKTALSVCEGQQYDMDFENRSDVTLAEYFTMIRLKTAVLLAGALEIGAIMADAPATTCEALYNYGINIGIAFQLQDDLLDLYGNEETFGKKIGNDIIEKKKTFLYLKALELIADGAALRTALQYSDISAVRSLYESVNIKQHCENEIKHYYNKALEFLTPLPQNNVLLSLKDLSDKLLLRTL